MQTDLLFKHEHLDTKSSSFCGAKWYNATIWLGSGMTTSCHHPLPHKIDAEAVVLSDENKSEEDTNSGYASDKDENNPF